jgi:probable rRNA maturation factor
MMEFEIEIQADVAVLDEEMALVETAVIATLQQQAIAPPAMLTVVLTNDATVRQLNRDYRHIDASTDVLSFPMGDAMPGMAMLDTIYLGDIIISVPFANQQAVASGHPAIAELQLLAVHGTLHLLGHDHADVAEKEVMWTAQTAVMTTLNLAHITPTEAAH